MMWNEKLIFKLNCPYQANASLPFGLNFATEKLIFNDSLRSYKKAS